MCKPFSCLVKSDLSVLVGQTVTTHSHSEILWQHGLPAERSIDQYARVELEIDGDYPADPDKWTLNLDEDREPSWWKPNLPEIDDRVRRAAWTWLAKIKAASDFRLEDDDILHLPFGSPVVQLHGGTLWCHDQSAPVVTQSGGDLWTFDNAAPVVTLTGGQLRAYGQSAPVVNGVQLRPGQMAEIVEGKLQITDF